MQPMISRMAPRRVARQPGAYRTSFPYYSTVIFRADADAGPPITYTFPQGIKRKAFSYAEGDDWTKAGAVAALDGDATLAETNLSKQAETVAGEEVLIEGIAIQIKPALSDGTRFSQSRLIAQLMANVAVSLSLNGGNNAYKLGTMGLIPGAGGLVGTGLDDLSPQVDGVQRRDFGALANGWQVRGNYYKLPEGLIWRPSGKTDSQLQVIFETVRPIVLTFGGDPDNPGVDGVEFVHPTKVGAAFTVHLVASQSADRSNVQ